MANEIQWLEEDRRYESGLFNGVLYPGSVGGVAWNGLISVGKVNSGEDPTPVYIDGVKVIDITSPRELSLELKAYMYPDEFLKYDGYAQLTKQAVVGEQEVRDVFHISYKTLINGTGDYKIHIFFNLVATPDTVDSNTLEEDPEAVEFSWTLNATPLDISEFKLRPSSYISIDSRVLDEDAALKKAILQALYGSEVQEPSISEFLRIITGKKFFSQGFVVIAKNDVEWTLRGPDEKIYYNTPDDEFVWTVAHEDDKIERDHELGEFMIIDDT